MRKILRKTNSSIGKELGALTALVLLCVIMSISSPHFLSLTNLMNILRQSTLIGIVAAGMTFVIITGGIDLSVGSVLSLASCITAGMIVNHEMNVWVSVFAGIILGAFLGFLNGLMITCIPLPPFIATLGIMGVARGLAFVYTGGAPIYTFPESFKFLGQGMIGPIPFPGHPDGRRLYHLLYSTEADEIRALYLRDRWQRRSGDSLRNSTGRYKAIVYSLTGAFAALAGMVLAARLDAATSVAGDGFELDVIAAVVIGGTSLSGGQGGVIGWLIGALIMGVVRNGLNLLLVSSHWQRVILGIIILAAVTVDVLRKKGVFLKATKYKGVIKGDPDQVQESI